MGKKLKKQSSVPEKYHQKSESNKNEKDKTKGKISRTKSNLVYDNYYTSYKYHNMKEFAKRPPDLKLNDLKYFEENLEFFYHDTKKIKPNNEDEEKNLQKRKVVVNTTSKLYDKLLNIYTYQYNKLSEDQKKTIMF